MTQQETFQTLTEISQQNLEGLYCFSGNHACMSGGVNGPYYDIETPIRNTAHWLITTAVLYKTQPSTHLLATTEKLLGYLLDNAHFKKGVAIHRQKPGKDWCNGVIGQAWVIEALAIAGKLLDRSDAVDRARQLAGVFIFSKSAKAWGKIDPANGKKRVDYTLNHQLWYAAAIALLDDNSLNAQIIQFLDSLNSGAMHVRRDGVVAHLLYARTPKGIALRTRYGLSEFKNGRAISAKEVGYHLYNLHPLARLKSQFPEHSIFRSQLLKSALDTAFSDEFVSKLDDNKYAYTYNSPAFEYPLIARVFQYQLDICNKAWQKQMLKTFDEDVSGFSRNCPDPMTLNARMYEWLLDIYYDKFLESED